MSQLQSLLSWAEEQGVQVQQGVSFKDTNKGLSFIYEGDEPLDNKKEVLKVPEHITITPFLAERVFGSQVIPRGNRTPLTQLLVAKLRFDANDTKTLDDDTNVSKLLYPFINFLPTGREIGCPLFWNNAERGLIRNTDADLAIDVGITNLVEEWYTVVTKLGKSFKGAQYEEDLKFYDHFQKEKDVFKHFEFFNDPQASWTSFSAYLWASSIFTSRGFPFLISSTDECRDLNEGMLVPIQDLSNHDNEVKVKWDKVETSNMKYMTFQTEQIVKKGDEIFSCYGPKSNQELLFGYGFVLENNVHDKAVLALRLPDTNIEGANKFGLGLKSNEVSYKVTTKDPLPKSLIDLFAYLVKTSEEHGVTLRNRLEGLDQLQSIVEQKIGFLKNLKNETHGNKINPYFIKIAKTYKTTQKLLFQQTLEEISKLTKSLLKQYKPLSFKSVLKQDKSFTNSLEQIFGTKDYETLYKADDIDRALLLWITRVSNKFNYPTSEQQNLPNWILDQYQEVLKTTKTLDSEDLDENKDLHKELFPTIAKKLPLIYGKGSWDLKSLVVSSKLIDQISYTRSTNNDTFLIENISI